MKVRDVMSARSPVTVGEHDDVGLAAQMMLWAGVRHIPVVRAGAVLGVLSDGDLTRPGLDRRTPAMQAMSAPAITVSPDTDLVEAASTLAARRIGCLPVVEDGQLVGMLTRTDLIAQEVARLLDEESRHEPTVADAMTRDPVTVYPDSRVVDATALMAAHGIRHLPVVDGDGHLVGMLSDRDVRSAIGDPSRATTLVDGSPTHLQALRVASIMSRPAYAVEESTPLAEVAARFVDFRIGAMPVVTDDHVVGIISYTDVIRQLLRGGRVSARAP